MRQLYDTYAAQLKLAPLLRELSCQTALPDKALLQRKLYEFYQLALTAGVPLELVQKVTGHKTTDIVLKHYFQPGREDFRRALQSAMPKLLTNGHKSPKDEMKALIDKVKPKA